MVGKRTKDFGVNGKMAQKTLDCSSTSLTSVLGAHRDIKLTTITETLSFD